MFNSSFCCRVRGMSLHHKGGAMVVEMLTTRRGSGFRRATGSGEGWLRLRWLQREEDEEGTAGGDCDTNGG
ncbi:hypothetical protein BHM03_00054546 [Ensete ventricosum]|nr:hypothetical protein BHM03_00054546 [Ensete ventricosum]